MLEHSNVWTQLVCRTVPYSVVSLVAAISLLGPRQIYSKFVGIGWNGLAACICLAAQDVAIVAGFLLTTAGNVAAIINLSPVFCAISDRFILGEPIPTRTLAMVIFGLTGLAIILAGDANGKGEYMQGNLVCLVNPVSWTAYWAIIRHSAKHEAAEAAAAAAAAASSAEEKPLYQWWERLLVYQVAAVFIGAAVGLVGGFNPESVEIPTDLGLYTLYGAVLLPLALVFFSVAPRYIPTAEVGCLKTLEILVVPLWMYCYNQEVPSESTFLGGALILFAVAGHSIAVLMEEQKEPDAQDLEARDMKAGRAEEVPVSATSVEVALAS
jgi:drug/metabolite transporter (DMT)-like permease